MVLLLLGGIQPPPILFNWFDDDFLLLLLFFPRPSKDSELIVLSKNRTVDCFASGCFFLVSYNYFDFKCWTWTSNVVRTSLAASWSLSNFWSFISRSSFTQSWLCLDFAIFSSHCSISFKNTPYLCYMMCILVWASTILSSPSAFSYFSTFPSCSSSCSSWSSVSFVSSC